MSIGPHHIGLTVPDLTRSQRWYREAFDLEPQLEFTLPNGVQGAMLASTAGAKLELFGIPDAEPGLRDADPPTAMLRSGYGHVAFVTDDLTATYDRALAAGAVSVWDPRPSPEPGAWMAFVHDPDGNLIELIGPQP